MEDKIPDAISFASLRKIHQEKADRIDFSAPMLSREIGDLSFLFDVFIGEKLDGQVMSHQQIFLADMLVTGLRRGYVESAKQAASDKNFALMEKLTKMTAFLSIAEGILDSLVRICMEQIGSSDTKPSYRLIKSLDPTVKPHEVDEWLASIYRS